VQDLFCTGESFGRSLQGADSQILHFDGARQQMLGAFESGLDVVLHFISFGSRLW
jgi:hypothetical protein